MLSKGAGTPAGTVGLRRSAGCSGHQERAAVLATVTVENREHPSLLAGMVWSWLPLTLATTTPTWLMEVLVTHPAPSPQPPRDALASALKRTELQHRPSSIPGREIVQVLTEIPVGVESGWHTHPGEEVGYIVAGTVEMAIHGQPTLTLQAGDGFLIPPRIPTTPVTSVPAPGTCCPPTSSRPGSHCPRLLRSRPTGEPPCPPPASALAAHPRAETASSGPEPAVHCPANRHRDPGGTS